MKLPRVSRSLASRLILVAAIWSVLVLAGAGWGLSTLYHRSVMSSLDRDLGVIINSLIASMRTDAIGQVQLLDSPNDPRFAQAFAGRYWEIVKIDSKGAHAYARSRSLWDEELSWPGGPAALVAKPGKMQFVSTPGPNAKRVRQAGLAVRLAGAETQFGIYAAADISTAEAEAKRFTTTLFAALTALALGLVVAVIVQVRVGLAPLDRLREEMARVRRGRAARLEGEYPREVAPLTAELNALLDHNREVVDRSRMLVGNLAHALKTPISVLLNEARVSQGPLADLVGRHADAMAKNVDHYLQRAQAAARAEAIGARVEAKAVLDDIARTLQRLYGRDQAVEISVEAPRDAAFRGERQDLEELVGNLMENACKYGGGTVQVRLTPPPSIPGQLVIEIEDDGPGLPPQQRERALQRGVRLDETAPGQGLGLSIVADLARAYGGVLELGDSVLGGLNATLRLPAVD